MTKPALQNIDAETQIFTPLYISRYLTQNSIGRIWLNSRPDSRLRDDMGYYVDSPTPSGVVQVDSPEEIRVIDPACGTGNLLVEAFKLLYKIYLDARYKPQHIPGLILQKNLVGRDIDAAAADACSAILTARAHESNSHFFRSGIHPDVRSWTEEDHPDAGLFGTLIRDLDTTKYHVVLANPPYMGSKHFTPRMSEFAKTHYPDSRRDLCAMFIERGFEMTVPGGMIAMITMDSWMFLSSFETMRRNMLSERTCLTMAHLGRGVFGSGAVISTTAFVHTNFPVPEWPGIYFRLVDSKYKQQELLTRILEFRGRDIA
ncbi:Eco57I restriction-modification methylase domain-containing protein [Gordonia iterans]